MSLFWKITFALLISFTKSIKNSKINFLIIFRLQPLQLNNKFLNIRAGNSSPRGGRKHPTIKSTNWSSSHTLNIPNSPLASRKHHSDQNNSANNSPVLKQKLRTRSFSDDRSSETLPLFNMIPSPENDEETYQLLTSENQNEKAEKPGKLESAVLWKTEKSMQIIKIVHYTLFNVNIVFENCNFEFSRLKLKCNDFSFGIEKHIFWIFASKIQREFFWFFQGFFEF